MFRQAARHLAAQASALQQTACLREFASLPAAASEAVAGEAVQLSSSAPVLLRLPERPWGATATLQPDLVSLISGNAPGRVGVVRDAFARHDAQPRPLRSTLAALAHGRVAVAAAVTEPGSKQVVDEYERQPDSTYRLKTIGTDLLWLLHREGLRVSYVPDVAAAAAGGFNSSRAALAGLHARQSTNEVLMVAPTAFTFNEQTAQDNHFMHTLDATSLPGAEAGMASLTQRVLQEFAGLHAELTERAGVHVNLFQHAAHHGTPDAVFPNNWFSTHAAGEAAGGVTENTLVLYPMKCPNRAAERRPEIIEVLRQKGYTRVVDLSSEEKAGRFFEGTGVLVLDRINGTAYVALSERADRHLAERWVRELGYKDLVTFTSTDKDGLAVYHTNVMMAIGTDVAVVASESVEDPKERQHLLARLRQHHQVVEISRAQMEALCGNVLELEDGRGHPVLAMSTQAHAAFTDDQRRVLRRHVAALHHAPIDTLEFIGGGGVRCALGEVF